LGLILAFSFSGIDLPGVDTEARVEISARPIAGFDLSDSSRRRFGDLEFRGGLILTSSSPSFGGLSALYIQKDGSRFVALTDRGSWLRGRIVYEGKRPAAIADAVMAPMLNTDGKAVGRLDAESMTADRGKIFVGVVRQHEILGYDYGKKGFLAPGKLVAAPPGIKDLPNNQGLEALVFIPKKLPLGGTLVALSEQGLNEAGDLKAFLIGGPSPGTFWIKRTADYDISDATLLPQGDLLILERKYSLQTGVAIRIRRVRLADIRPGVTVDGPTVLEADKHFAVDNAEAMGVHRTPAGETVLTLLSDDNFSRAQRTLLLQFTLVGDGASTPHSAVRR